VSAKPSDYIAAKKAAEILGVSVEKLPFLAVYRQVSEDFDAVHLHGPEVFFRRDNVGAL
jgi:tRNA U34 2-thiouridine synthase MnmA/TrmU